MGGIQNNLKICGSARASWPRSSANIVELNKIQYVTLRLLRLGSTAWDFWGVNFWSMDFLGVLLEAPGIFFLGGGVDCPRDSFGF